MHPTTIVPPPDGGDPTDIDRLIHELLVAFEIIDPDSDPGVIHELVQKLMRHLGFLSLSGFSPLGWGVFLARATRDIRQARRDLDEVWLA